MKEYDTSHLRMLKITDPDVPIVLTVPVLRLRIKVKYKIKPLVVGNSVARPSIWENFKIQLLHTKRFNLLS